MNKCDSICYFECDNCHAVATAPTSDVKNTGHPMCPACTDREMGEITQTEYQKRCWFVYSDSEQGFWNDERGWVDFNSASTVQAEFKSDMDLPAGGRWVDRAEAKTLNDDPEKGGSNE